MKRRITEDIGGFPEEKRVLLERLLLVIQSELLLLTIDC